MPSLDPIVVGGLTLEPVHLLVALAIVVMGFVVASFVASRIRKLTDKSGRTFRWRATLAQLVGHSIRGLSVVAGLEVAGVDIASVLAAGAVLAVGIGIAMQKVAENFVSGVILFAEHSIREGDVIEFEGRIAKVHHIGIRATIAQTLDDEEIVVPNSILTQSAVKNLTLTDPDYRIRVDIGVAYGTDVDRAFEVLEAAARDIPWRDPRHDPVILLVGFGASSIDFEVSVWTRDAWSMRRGQSNIRRAVWRALRDARITIPFPQLDVHFDVQAPPAVLSVSRPDA